MTKNTRIAIIGGSLAGLTTALNLLKKGFDVHIYEQAPTLFTKGVALNVYPNAMRVMQHLGLYDELLDTGTLLEKIHILQPSGKRLKIHRFKDYYPRPVSIRRIDLQELLLRHFPKERYHTNHHLEHYTQKDGVVTSYFSTGEMIESDILIGADGINSKVREVMLNDVDELRFSGYACWRGFTKIDRPIANSETWGSDQRAVIVNTGDGKIAWWLSAEEEPNTPDQPEGTRNKLIRLFRGWHEPIYELIASTDEIIKMDVHDRLPSGGWYNGNVVIIGDAAHPCTPTTGHGGCAAIEDSAVLTRCLEKYKNPTLAFEQFEKNRLPRIKSIVRDARILGAIGHWSNPLAVAFRNLVLQRNNRREGLDVNNVEKYFDYDAFEVEV